MVNWNPTRNVWFWGRVNRSLVWPPCDHCLLLNEYKWNWAGRYENINYNVILRQDILTIYTSYFVFLVFPGRTDYHRVKLVLTINKIFSPPKINIHRFCLGSVVLCKGLILFVLRQNILPCIYTISEIYIQDDIYQKSVYLHPNNLYFEGNLHWNLSIYHKHLEKCNSLLFRNQIRVTLLMPNRFYWFRLM